MIAASARFLLQRNGRVVQMARMVTSAYNTNTSVTAITRETWLVAGLSLRENVTRRNGEINPNPSERILLAATDLDKAPQLGDEITCDDTVFAVTRIETVRERTAPMAYICDVVEK